MADTKNARQKRSEAELMLRKKHNDKRVNTLAFILMTLPALIIVFVIAYIPMFGIVLPFKDFSYDGGIWGSPWADPLLKNFKLLLTTADMGPMFARTIFYALLNLLLIPLCGILVALLLNELRNQRAVKTYQTVLLWPSYLSAVVLAYIAYSFLSPRAGLLGQIYEALGKDPINVYKMPEPWKYIIPIIGIWSAAGSGSLLYYATIIGIDPTYYEAAALDGANRWQMMTRITLPHLKSIVAIGLILNVGNILSSDLGLFYNLPMESPLITKELMVLDVYIFKSLSSSGNIAVPSAVDFFKSVVRCILVVTANLVVKKIDPDSSLF